MCNRATDFTPQDISGSESRDLCIKLKQLSFKTLISEIHALNKSTGGCNITLMWDYTLQLAQIKGT